MHKKKYAFDQINKLQNENRKLLEDLKFLERYQKETKQKYKKQVKLLMQKIEELRGYQIKRKESTSSDDSNSQNSSQLSRLHYKIDISTTLYEPPEQLLKILPDEINN